MNEGAGKLPLKAKLCRVGGGFYVRVPIVLVKSGYFKVDTLYDVYFVECENKKEVKTLY